MVVKHFGSLWKSWIPAFAGMTAGVLQLDSAHFQELDPVISQTKCNTLLGVLQWDRAHFQELDDTRLLPRALRADSVVRSGIRQLLLRCSTSGIHAVACLRSSAGMTGWWGCNGTGNGTVHTFKNRIQAFAGMTAWCAVAVPGVWA